MKTSKDLQAKVLQAFAAALDDEEIKPQVIAAAVTYLKAFPPDEAPEGGDVLTPEQEEIIGRYADKIKKFPQ